MRSLTLAQLFDVALLVAWSGILGTTIVRYRRGRLDRTKAYGWSAAAVVWVAFSLLQISALVGGVGATAVQVAGAGFLCVGLALGVRWWRLRQSQSADAE